MALDTSNKRFSMMGFGNPSIKLVDPSGSVDAPTRATFMDLYEGITLSNPSGITLLNFMRGFGRGYNTGFSRGF